jgi:hypothetical protein
MYGPWCKMAAPYHEAFGKLCEVRNTNLAATAKHDGGARHCVLFDGVVREW